MKKINIKPAVIALCSEMVGVVQDKHFYFKLFDPFYFSFGMILNGAVYKWKVSVLVEK